MDSLRERSYDISDYKGSILENVFEFKLPLKTVWASVRKLAQWTSLIKEVSSIKLENDKPLVVGSKFWFVYKEWAKSENEILEVKESDFFCRIAYLNFVISEPTWRFIGEYNLYKNTYNNTTVMSYVVRYPILIPGDLYHMIDHEIKSILRKNNKKLLKENNFTEQIETCLIDTNINSVWNVISNFSKFREICPSISSKLIENADKVVDVNDTFFLDMEGVTVKMTVLSVEKVDGKNQSDWSIVLVTDVPSEVSTKEMKLPKQTLFFKLSTISSKKTLFLFKHRIEMRVENEHLVRLKEKKKEIFLELISHFNKIKQLKKASKGKKEDVR